MCALLTWPTWRGVCLLPRAGPSKEVMTMPEYKVPLRDIDFVMNEVLEAEKLFQTLPGYEEATTDLMNAINEERGDTKHP